MFSSLPKAGRVAGDTGRRHPWLAWKEPEAGPHLPSVLGIHLFGGTEPLRSSWGRLACAKKLRAAPCVLGLIWQAWGGGGGREGHLDFLP